MFFNDGVDRRKPCRIDAGFPLQHQIHLAGSTLRNPHHRGSISRLRLVRQIQRAFKAKIVQITVGRCTSHITKESHGIADICIVDRPRCKIDIVCPVNNISQRKLVQTVAANVQAGNMVLGVFRKSARIKRSPYRCSIYKKPLQISIVGLGIDSDVIPACLSAGAGWYRRRVLNGCHCNSNICTRRRAPGQIRHQHIPDGQRVVIAKKKHLFGLRAAGFGNAKNPISRLKFHVASGILIQNTGKHILRQTAVFKIINQKRGDVGPCRQTEYPHQQKYNTLFHHISSLNRYIFSVFYSCNSRNGSANSVQSPLLVLSLPCVVTRVRNRSSDPISTVTALADS